MQHVYTYIPRVHTGHVHDAPKLVVAVYCGGRVLWRHWYVLRIPVGHVSGAAKARAAANGQQQQPGRDAEAGALHDEVAGQLRAGTRVRTNWFGLPSLKTFIL